MVIHYEFMSLQKLTFTAWGLESQNCETSTTFMHQENLLFTPCVLLADFRLGLGGQHPGGLTPRQAKGLNESESDRKFMLSRWQY